MIFYIVLLCLHTCHCITVTRGELFDTARGVVVCGNKCTCQSPTATFFNVPGEEKCMGANGTGCSLRVDGYTTDVPLITNSILNKTVLRIFNGGENLCPNTSDTNEASSVRMLALTDEWENGPTFMSKLFSYSIPNVKEVKVNFHAVWSGLLIKLEVKCNARNGNEDTPRENCVLFKYEGTATYPLNLSSFAPEFSTTPEPSALTTTTATTISTTAKTTTASKETNTSSKSNTEVTHPSLKTSTPVTSTSTTHSTSKDNNDNRDIAMAAGFAATVILILVTIIIILICYKTKLDRRTLSRKVAYTKSNTEENIYDKVNKKEEDEKKGENEVIEFPNTTYGNKINLYAKVDDSDEHKIQKQDSHYYNANYINKNLNYYNVHAGKEMSHVDNKAINTMNVNEYDQIWSNNGEDEKKVKSSQCGNGGDKSSRDDVDVEENAYTVTGGFSDNI